MSGFWRKLRCPRSRVIEIRFDHASYVPALTEIVVRVARHDGEARSGILRLARPARITDAAAKQREELSTVGIANANQAADAASGAIVINPNPTSATDAAATSSTAVKTARTSWTNYRGINRDGRYDEQKILTTWPAGGLTPVWKQPVGGGYASFVIADNVAFTIEGHRFSFAKGSSIHTENSHKYGPRGARLLLLAGGWTPIAEWTDPDEDFALILAEAQRERFAP